MPVKILKCVAWRVAQSARAASQFWTDKRQPDFADHSHSWTQARGRAARMIFKVFLDIGFYHGRQFFNCKRDHNLETCMDRMLDLESPKTLRATRSKRCRDASRKNRDVVTRRPTR